MSCNTKLTVEADFSSVASTIATIELATPLAYEYPEFLNDALLQFNDPSVVIPAIRFGIENLTNTIAVLYDEILRNDSYTPILREEYPSLDNRVSQPTLISYTELADFLMVMAYPDLPTLDRLIENDPRKVLKDLNHYYGQEMSGSSVSLCSLLDNPFAKIKGMVDSITDMKDNILSLLPSIAGALQSFAETIKKKVEEIFEQMKDVVSNLGDTMNSIAQGVSNIPAVFAGLSSTLSKQFAALQNLFSQANLENLKEGIEKFVAKAVKQFQKILENPEVILYLLYMFCKTASFIESALKNPVQAFQSMVGNIQTEQNVLRVHSAPKTQAAIFAGRPVATEASVDKVREQATTWHNMAVANQVTNGEDTSEPNVQIVHNQKNLTHPDPNSWSNLKFTFKVINNPFWLETKKYQTYEGTWVAPRDLGISPDIGYYKAYLKEMEMLNEVGKAMGKTLTITSAYRHPLYNKKVGGERKSSHMKGNAFDVLITGNDRKTFCSLAHKIGFKGFGGYSWGIHVDTTSYRSWYEHLLPPGPWIK